MRGFLAITAISAASLTLGTALTAAPVGAVLPSGFTDTTLAAPAGNPVSAPTAITPLPDGRALILEKAGGVRMLLADGTLSATDALSLSVCTISETGLLGAAVAADFASTGFVYLFYTRSAGNCSSSGGRFNRVSRFTMRANTIDPGSEAIVLDNIVVPAGNHNGGDLEFGHDGYLYVSTGDGGTNPRGSGASAAQDLSLLNGKILRISPTGGTPADNPYVGEIGARSCATVGVNTVQGTDVCTEIYGFGLRNPYRFAFDPNAIGTRFFINDVGDAVWEEVDEGGRGVNYGWDGREGRCYRGSETDCPSPPDGVTDPITVYNHRTGCTFITAGAFVPNGVWRASDDGSYLFADGGCDTIWQRTAAGTVDYDTPFATVSGTIVDMAFVDQPVGTSLFYVSNSSSEIHRITAATVRPPTLAFRPLAAAIRPFDSRTGPGTNAGRVLAGTTRDVDLGLGDPTVRAALINVTMVQPVMSGYLTVSAGPSSGLPTSNVNAAAGEFVANASIVPVDSAGHVSLYASVTTDVVVDVMGVFSEVASGAMGGRLTGLTPTRVIDTRLRTSATNAYSRQDVGPVSTVSTRVVDSVGVPPGVQAVAVVVTGIADPSSGPGFVSVRPGHAAAPPTSNLNVNGNGDIRPNLVIVPLAADRSIDLELANVANVVVDVVGFFAVRPGPTGSFHLLTSQRQVDTRTPFGFGPLGVGSTASFVPNVPSGATAISQNVTMTNTLGPGFVTAYPSGAGRPEASNGNATGPRQDRAALTLTRLAAGSVTYASSGGTDLVVDVTGWFD